MERTLVIAALATALVLAPVAVHAVPSIPVTDSNPWMTRTDLNIAHQGGNHEFPGNTLYALKESRALGADAFEVDLHRTLDGHVVAIHDATVDRTTQGSGPVQHMTLDEVKQLDAAYWWLPGEGSGNHSADADAYPYRGVATGDEAPPTGYTANDLRVPTLEEILDEFPSMMMVLELKAQSEYYVPFEREVVELLAEYDRGDGVIVNGFNDGSVESFKAQAAAAGLDVTTGAGLGQSGVFWATSQEDAPGTPNPRHHALQLPPTYEGVPVMSQDLVDDAHANDLAVHVWTLNTEEAMHTFLDMGVDGVLTDRPSLLQDVYAERAS